MCDLCQNESAALKWGETHPKVFVAVLAFCISSFAVHNRLAAKNVSLVLVHMDWSDHIAKKDDEYQTIKLSISEHSYWHAVIWPGIKTS